MIQLGHSEVIPLVAIDRFDRRSDCDGGFLLLIDRSERRVAAVADNRHGDVTSSTTGCYKPGDHWP